MPLARARGLTYPVIRGQVRRLLPIEKEEHFLRRVLELMRAFGFDLAYHTYDSRKSFPGFPDIVAVRPPRVLFVELKVGHNDLTLEQKVWRAALSRCPGVEYYCWRPSDWPTIVRTLSRRAA